MDNYSEIRAKINKRTDVLIRSSHPDVNLHEPLYAVNWFSTKVECLYSFYNLLAFRSVLKIGGKALLKAKVSETLVDDNNGKRELLLIVRYPKGENFKSLMESTYFKMISIFRVLSVSHFTFGFTHKLVADTQSKKSDDLTYAIHHFKAGIEASKTIEQITRLLPSNISIKYTGLTVANLYTQEKNKEARQVPNLMDALVVFQSKTEEELKLFFASEAYQNLLKDLPVNYIGLLNRIF